MWSVCVSVLVCTYAAAVAAASGGGAPSCAAAAAAATRCSRVGGGASDNESEYSVDGIKIIIDYVDGKYFSLECTGRRALDSNALPRFERALRVPAVMLAHCPPPDTASFAAALAALHVTLLPGNLTLLGLPPTPSLAAHHFAGLEHLAALRVTGSAGRRPAPVAGFLAPLRALRLLALQLVRLAPDELDAAPPTLRVLSLRDTGVGRLAEAVLASDLRELVVTDGGLVEFAVPAKLRTLSLNLRNTSLRVESIPSLETLMLTAWSEERPGALTRCDALRSLLLTRPALAALPARWVAACPRLERLALSRAARLTMLPARLLEGARALAHLALVRGVLETLPEGLLDDAPNLRTLDLTGNRLRTLPSATFLGPRTLQGLQLASNALDASAAEALAALHDLTDLSIAFNPRLGDLCDDGSFGYSRLNNLKKLTSLSLNRTNITRICRDWRDNLMLLKTLDLRNTRVAELWYEDLQYRRADSLADADVYLQGAPVVSVRLTRRDYDAGPAAPASGATVHLNGTLECDCNMYWTRLALERSDRGMRVLGLRCAGGRALRDVAVDDMLCPAPDACAAAGLPRACTCAARDAADGAAGTGAAGARLLVRAHCEHAALRRVPRLRAAAGVLYDLLLAHNNISELHAADLPASAEAPDPRAADPSPHLRELDLRNNSLVGVDEDAAIALGSSARRVLLSGNPLVCDCGAVPLLRALNGRDLLATRCGDGRALDSVRVLRCGPRVPAAAWAAGALAALLAATAAVVAYFAPAERRVVLKVLLFRWGLLRRETESDDDGRPYDAFVSFSHEDENVMHELVERLESGPAPYRLCLHYRDWVPGRFIPDQIAESVQRSRRTLTLVSQHFLRSTWARAEFREAYAHALREVSPRLVVVLLEDPTALPLDADLRRYLAANTYVRWGDPWFWDKLRLALPTPRPRPLPSPAPPAPASPSASAPQVPANAPPSRSPAPAPQSRAPTPLSVSALPPPPASLSQLKCQGDVPTGVGRWTEPIIINSVK